MKDFLKNETLLIQELPLIFCSGEASGKKSSDFDLSLGQSPKNIEFQPASVLVPITFDTDGPGVVFIKRATTLKDHPGQIGFPGGKVERGDSSQLETVIRECYEEIYLKKEDTNVLGTLPQHNTVTGYSITPFVGVIKSFEKLKPDLSEVVEIFKVPLDFLLTKDNMRVHFRSFDGDDRSYFVIAYGPYYIWGATARIVKTFSDLIEGYEKA